MASTPFAIFSRWSNARSRKGIQTKNVTTAPLNTTTEGATSNYRPSTFDKKVLVWNKKFRNVKEVPEHVSTLKMEKARNLTRIKVNVALTVLTAVACLGVIISGKFAAKTGDSMTRRNLEWHEKHNAKGV